MRIQDPDLDPHYNVCGSEIGRPEPTKKGPAPPRWDMYSDRNLFLKRKVFHENFRPLVKRNPGLCLVLKWIEAILTTWLDPPDDPFRYTHYEPEKGEIYQSIQVCTQWPPCCTQSNCMYTMTSLLYTIYLYVHNDLPAVHNLSVCTQWPPCYTQSNCMYTMTSLLYTIELYVHNDPVAVAGSPGDGSDWEPGPRWLLRLPQEAGQHNLWPPSHWSV